MRSSLLRLTRFRTAKLAMAATAVQVTQLPPNERASTAHHGKGRFHNPWNSFREFGITDMAGVLGETGFSFSAHIPDDIDDRLPVRTPTWGKGADDSAIKATWLGHACFLVELPREEGKERGVRILFDPVFSHRCSPSQLIGPARFTKAPCKIEDIPQVDAIVISHNHYDHMDTHTITTLFKSQTSASHTPHVFAPLGNEHYFASLHAIPKTHAHTLDWWHALAFRTPHGDVKIHCLPAQHVTGRGITDRFKSLWASWAVESAGTSTGKKVKVWFGGDTGYKSVPREGVDDEDSLPHCPAFKEIGEAFGEFDLAMIPIGAYLPRWFMSPMHCAPQDSVRVFRDVRAKKAVGMHWGTWVLTTEDVLEPPELLRREAEKLGIAPDAFVACKAVGETVVVE